MNEVHSTLRLYLRIGACTDGEGMQRPMQSIKVPVKKSKARWRSSTTPNHLLDELSSKRPPFLYAFMRIFYPFWSGTYLCHNLVKTSEECNSVLPRHMRPEVCAPPNAVKERSRPVFPNPLGKLSIDDAIRNFTREGRGSVASRTQKVVNDITPIVRWRGFMDLKNLLKKKGNLILNLVLV